MAGYSGIVKDPAVKGDALSNEMTSTPHDRVGHPDGAKPAPGKILFVGSSSRLDALRTWAQSRRCSIVEEPETDVVLVVADEDVLDGLCTAKQGEILAASRALGITCLPPDLARTRLSGLDEPVAEETAILASETPLETT